MSRAQLITGRLVVDPPLDGGLNMAIDELLLRSVQALRLRSGQAGQETLTLRFFQWAEPTLSLGRLQSWEEGRGHPWVREGRPVVRRPTGGGAVEHAQDLSFSLAWVNDGQQIPRGVRESYRFIHGILQEALRHLGCTIELAEQEATPPVGLRRCFAVPSRDDLLLTGEKIAGGAQWHSHGCVLHQGTLRLPWYEHLVTTLEKTFGDALSCEWDQRPLTDPEWEKARARAPLFRLEFLHFVV
ncbi:MAG: hypothetical protein HYZ73_02520 [Elusimicrobia bacterium]|nr:hypothetical protein [Elusimicrobiota bacterium]